MSARVAALSFQLSAFKLAALGLTGIAAIVCAAAIPGTAGIHGALGIFGISLI
jgi:hypothetical protein